MIERILKYEKAGNIRSFSNQNMKKKKQQIRYGVSVDNKFNTKQ